MISQNSTTRPPGVEERRRVEEQEEEQDHRKDPGFARPITLATTGSSRVGVLCEYFARFSFSRLGGGGLEDGGGHVGFGLGGRGERFGIGLGNLALWQPVHAAVLRRAEPATRTGRPAVVPCERSFASFTGAVNRYNSHIV